MSSELNLFEMPGAPERPLDQVLKPDDIMYVQDLKMHFPVTRGLLKRQVGAVKAVDGVSFNIKRGQTLGIVGESGSGKSTVGNCLLRNLTPTSGHVYYEGHDMKDLNARSLQRMRKNIQMITQDPFASLDPRMNIMDVVSEGLKIHRLLKDKREQDDFVVRQLELVGINPDFRFRYPHEFSGGQRQRICIARALALKPEFIVCDEPVSALDVSIQAQIINLLKELQEQYKFTYLFISHDLSVVEHISDTVGVMYLGNLVEYGATEDIFKNPLHPYTKALFSAIPVPDPTAKMNRIVLEGSIPSPANPPAGCKFHTRCAQCMEQCKTEVPEQREIEPGHFVVCHLYDQK